MFFLSFLVLNPYKLLEVPFCDEVHVVHWLLGSPSHQLLDLHPVPVQSCPSWEVSSPFPQPTVQTQVRWPALKELQRSHLDRWWLETHNYLVASWTHHGVASPRWGRLLPCSTWDSIFLAPPSPIPYLSLSTSLHPIPQMLPPLPR